MYPKDSKLQNIISKIDILKSDYINNVKIKVAEHWDKEWQDLTENKLREIKDVTASWISGEFSKKEAAVISRLRIGLSRYTHSYLLERKGPTICEVCSTQITIKHIISDCSKYEDKSIIYNIKSLRINLQNNFIDNKNIILFFKRY